MDFETGQVYVGKDFHADCVPDDFDLSDKDRRFRGGNLYFDDAHIVYELTLNVKGNLAVGGTFDDILIIADEETRSRVDAWQRERNMALLQL